MSASWMLPLRQAIDHDKWGQPIEAITLYHRIIKDLQSRQKENRLEIIPDIENGQEGLKVLERKMCFRSAISLLQRRIQAIQHKHPLRSATIEDVTSLLNLALGEDKEEHSNNKSDASEASDTNDTYNVPDDWSGRIYYELYTGFDVPNDGKGYLLPAPLPEPGKKYLRIKIEKIDLKDAMECFSPFIVIYVRDQTGSDGAPPQVTPMSLAADYTHIPFDCDVEFTRALADFPAGFAIFFELRYRKPLRHFISTKCYSVLEDDEIKTGPTILELYKKPISFKRKNFRLLTKKPLYLHLVQTIYGT